MILLVLSNIFLPISVRIYVAPIFMLYTPIIWGKQNFHKLGLATISRKDLQRLLISSAIFLITFCVVITFVFESSWTRPANILNLVATEVLVVALSEEIFFRGWLQPKVQQHQVKTWNIVGLQLTLANVLTSLVFALTHLVADFSLHRLLVFFPSLWFGWLRTNSNSIWPAIIAHAASNVLMYWALNS